MNLFAKITETLSAIVGKEVKADTATELDEALIALKAERDAVSEHAGPAAETSEEDEPTAEERLQADNDLLTARIEALEADEQKVKDELATSKSQNAKLTEELKTAYADIEAVRASLKDAEAKIETLEAAVREARAAKPKPKVSATFPETATKSEDNSPKVVKAASTGKEIFPKMTLIHR